MKNSIKYTFLIGIIIYLIYEKIFYTLSSFNSILLFKFNFNSNFYFLGFILVAFLSAVIAFLLYRYFIHKEQIDIGKVRKAVIFLVFVLLLYFTTNKYLGQISASNLNKEIFEKQLEFYAYPDLIFTILSIVLFFVFTLILFIKKNRLK